MQKILVLGAGQSAPYLIRYLLDHAEEHDWFITVGDQNTELAQSRVGDHPRGDAMQFDMTDALMLSTTITNADLVVNFMPPKFQPLIAWECVQKGCSMVSVSYRNEAVRDLDNDARRKGIILLPEMGLDPGIDVMTASEIIDRVRSRGGIVECFESYGGGLPATGAVSNPMNYVITWNPRNVVMAAEEGAQYLRNGKIKIVPWHAVFSRSWPVDVQGIGTMEGYPNRDSLSYRDIFGLDHAKTMIRGTLRYPGWSETWGQIVRLGLPNEHLRIPNLSERSFAEIVEMFLPTSASGSTLEERVANLLQISPTGQIMQKLHWLGLFDEEPIGECGETAAEALIHLLESKLALQPGGKDLVVIQHALEVRYPDEGGRRERIVSTFTDEGDPNGMTAMARAVGLPAAIAARFIVTGRFPLTGSHIPTHPAIYDPVLRELEREGYRFAERVEELPPA